MTRLAYVLTFVLASCVTGLIGAFLWIAPANSPVKPGANDLENLSFQPHPGARLPLDEELDEDGHAVTLARYFSKSPVIIVLDYLRCTALCGVTLRHLIGETLNRLPLEPGRDYQLLAISIDPRDRPSDAAAAAAGYASLLDRGGAKSGLHFLTGNPATVRKIAGTVGFPYRYDSLLDAYIHPAGFIVAAPDGVISHYVQDFAVSPSELLSYLADAEQDKSQGPLTRLLLLCHVQGAPLGRWTVTVMAAFMGADIVAGLSAIVIFAAIRRQRYR